MKKKIVLLTLVFSSVCCYSQDKNRFLIGGEIGGMYSSSNISDLKTNNSGSSLGGFAPISLISTYGENYGDFTSFYFNVNQSVLVYLTGRLLTGLEFSILNETNTYDSELIIKTNNLSYSCFTLFTIYDLPRIIRTNAILSWDIKRNNKR